VIDLRDKSRFLQDLLVAELLARRGEGPLARPRWPRPAPVTPRAPDETEARG
jgi:hypothetical protein